MKLNRIKLQGFLSYRNATLDLSGVNIACISGMNGAGKSSILDAITWGLFGQARRKDDSIINQACDMASVTLEFEYESVLYQVQRSKKKDRPVTLEVRIQSNGKWKPITEATIRETEAKIQSILKLDYETFVNASFFLQGRADQFAQQKPGDRKRILLNILGLDTWEAYREITVSRRRTLENDAASLTGRKQEILAELEEEPIRVRRLSEVYQTAEALTASRAAQEKLYEQLKASWDSIEQIRAQAAALANEMSILKGRAEKSGRVLGEREKESSRYRAILERGAEIEGSYRALLNVRQRIAAMDASSGEFHRLQVARSTAVGELNNAKMLLQQDVVRLENREAAIRNLMEKNNGLQQTRSGKQAVLSPITAEIESIARLEEELERLRTANADARAENPRLKSEMEGLRDRIESIKSLGHEETCNCPFCAQPMTAEARDKLNEDLTSQGKALAEKYRANEKLVTSTAATLAKLQGDLSGLRSKENTARSLSREIAVIDTQIEGNDATIDEWNRTGAVDLAEKRQTLDTGNIGEAVKARIARIDEELRGTGYDVVAREALRTEEARLRQSEDDKRTLDTATAALAPLLREIEVLRQQVTLDEADVKEKSGTCDKLVGQMAEFNDKAVNLEETRHQLEQAKAKEAQARQDVGAAQQRVDVLQTLKEKLTEVDEQKEGIARQISQLGVLEKAFSKDGIPALLIEQALPEIETEANRILSELTGGSMSVSFSTQKEFKDKKRDDLKETLDIVIDTNGDTREYETLSGGEAFRVNFAIRLALSGFLARRAGAKLQMLVIDEGFGSQDESGRQRLVEAINAVADKFEKILVVTHIESLKDAFPTRIEVSKTENGSTISIV